MNLRCITIDDEPPALDLMCRFIGQTPFLSLAGTFSNAIESLRFISENEVDLIFLDIQMPDLSGIELARILSGRSLNQAPLIIFTTAFDQFALEGYKLDVIDYLLKPFGYEDFLRGANKALGRARLRMVTSSGTGPTAASAAAVTDAAATAAVMAAAAAASAAATAAVEEFLYLKVEFQTVKIPCARITYIEGLKDYAKIHLANSEKAILSLITLKALEEKLPKGKFMRIHKSAIVSLDKITSVTRNSVYIGDIMLPVSDQYKEEFGKFADGWR